MILPPTSQDSSVWMEGNLSVSNVLRQEEDTEKKPDAKKARKAPADKEVEKKTDGVSEEKKAEEAPEWQCRSQRFLFQLGKFLITLLWILNKTKSLDLMEYIQEPSRRQEGHDGHDKSREEEYKVVLDFSSYYIIDGWLHAYMIHDSSSY